MKVDKRFKHVEVMNSLAEAYKLMVEKKPVKYTGPLLTSSDMLGVCFNIDERLKRYKYEVREQGRTPLEIILSCAFQLGIQQGIYKCVDKPSCLEIDEDDKARFKKDIAVFLMTKEEQDAMMDRITSFSDADKKKMNKIAKGILSKKKRLK